MKIFKATHQTTEAADENVYIIRGLFRRRLYIVAGFNLYEITEVSREKETE